MILLCFILVHNKFAGLDRMDHFRSSSCWHFRDFISYFKKI